MLDELRVVGYSADLRHLVLRDASGASRFTVRVDAELLQLLGETSSANGQDAPVEDEPPLEVAGEATEGEAATVPDPRRVSRLSPREIQAALRAGKPSGVVAQEAGTDEEWVARWLPPIEAERERVLADMRSCRLSRARLGPSSARFGEAVERHLAVHGLITDDPTLRWSAARAEGDPRWSVQLFYHVRGRAHRAVWDFNPETGEIHARNDLATSVAWTRASTPGAAQTPPLPTGAATDAAESTPAEPVSRRESTMSNGARKSSGASSAKRAGTKKSTAKKSSARKSTPRKSTARKSTARKSTAKKATAKKSTARKSTAKKATAKKSTARKSTPRKAAARTSTAKKATPRKATAKRTAKKTTPRR